MPDRLLEQTKVLADRVGALVEAVETLDRRTNRSERVVIGVIITLALVFLLSVGLVVGFFQIRYTADQVAETQHREERTREEALCPLYNLFLGAYNPESRPEGDARQKYIEQFDVIRESRETLECTGPLVPPPTPR